MGLRFAVFAVALMALSACTTGAYDGAGSAGGPFIAGNVTVRPVATSSDGAASATRSAAPRSVASSSAAPNSAAVVASLPSPARPMAVADGDAYRLGTGDQVRVTVFGEPDLSGTFSVDGSGEMALPLIGEMTVASLTLREFEGLVDERLRAGYLKEPKVSAEVVSFRPFYILGEVEKPGTYPFQSGLTVLNAVATAEGFTYRANQRHVFIRRAGDENEAKVPLTSTTQVQPGDTIRIGERFF